MAGVVIERGERQTTMERLDASLDDGPLFDPVKAAGSLGVLALIVLCGWAEVRLVWWAIDAAASLAS